MNATLLLLVLFISLFFGCSDKQPLVELGTLSESGNLKVSFHLNQIGELSKKKEIQS